MTSDNRGPSRMCGKDDRRLGPLQRSSEGTKHISWVLRHITTEELTVSDAQAMDRSPTNQRASSWGKFLRSFLSRETTVVLRETLDLCLSRPC